MTTPVCFLRQAMRLLCSGFCAMLLTACSSDVENLYANIRAFFRFSPVTQVPCLHMALNNPGGFCTITFPNGKYRFEGNDGNSYGPLMPTAVDQYGRPESIAGFIVGTPSIPDLSGNHYNVAFDLACPNCYTNDAIQRSLSLGATTVSCSRCARSYDLNNGGIVCAGNGGRSLYRYRISYVPSTGLLLIQN